MTDADIVRIICGHAMRRGTLITLRAVRAGLLRSLAVEAERVEQNGMSPNPDGVMRQTVADWLGSVEEQLTVGNSGSQETADVEQRQETVHA